MITCFDTAFNSEFPAGAAAYAAYVDGALGSHTAWLCEPYADAPDRTGNCYLDPDGVADHLTACADGCALAY